MVRQVPSGAAAGRRPPLLPRRRAPGARLPRLVRRERRSEPADWSAGSADPAPSTQSAGAGSGPSSRSRETARTGRREKGAGGRDAGVAACTRARTTASTTMSRNRSRCTERRSSSMASRQLVCGSHSHRRTGSLHTGHHPHHGSRHRSIRSRDEAPAALQCTPLQCTPRLNRRRGSLCRYKHSHTQPSLVTSLTQADRRAGFGGTGAPVLRLYTGAAHRRVATSFPSGFFTLNPSGGTDSALPLEISAPVEARITKLGG